MSFRQCALTFICGKLRSSKSEFVRPAVITVAIATMLVAVGASSAVAQQTPKTKLDGMAQAQISATIGRNQAGYHFVAENNGASAVNAQNSLSADFNPSGVRFRSGNNHWNMTLRGYGHGDNLVAVKPASPQVKANRLEYWREGLTEWYVNGPVGLEQGFTLPNAPSQANGQPLTLALDLSGDLTASVDGGRGLILKNSGSVVLRYSGLVATDADGHDLRAWLEVANTELRLKVDDHDAKYPLIVDPMVQSVELTNNVSGCILNEAAIGVHTNTSCSSGAANDQFGYSTAISSDASTVVVGAPEGNGTNPGSGAAYVFVRPSRGWGSCITVGCDNYVAKLNTGLGGGQGAGFAVSVAISGDGNTIAVLSNTFPKTDSGAGLVDVFVKPSTGWATTTAYGQYAILSLDSTETPCNQTDANPNDCSTIFPSSMSISGDGSVIALGYTGGLVNNLSDGAVYVFVRPSTGWADNYQPIKLTASDGAHLDFLGFAVSVNSDGTVIAATANQANGYAGAVYLFFEPNGGWANETQGAKLTYAPGDGYSFLGNSVGISGDGHTVVAGGNGKGFIFLPTPRLFCIIGGGCTTEYLWSNRSEAAQLSGSDQPISRFTISADGNTIAAAAEQQNSPGVVYLFPKGASWTSTTESQKISASDGAPNDGFGGTAVSGGAIALDNSG